MPRKKEVEEQIDVVKKERKETFATRWFKDYAVDNREEMKICCDITARQADEMFRMKLKTGNTEMFAVVYYATFITILEFLASKQKSSVYNDFSIEICNSINIGYTNDTSDENEKIGNFMPIIEHINVNRNIIDDMPIDDPNASAANLTKWMVTNSKKGAEYYLDISNKAYAKLEQEYHTRLRIESAVIPLFCIFNDAIVNVLKQKYKELQGSNSVSEVKMNVFGLYTIFYSFDEETSQESIEYQPSIRCKLALKNDENAFHET